jgi:hypothetical protein
VDEHARLARHAEAARDLDHYRRPRQRVDDPHAAVRFVLG